MKKSLRQVGDSIFDKRMLRLAEKYPYHSFVIMSSALEFLGKCYRMIGNFQEGGHARDNIKSAIENLSALSAYNDYSEKMYKSLRCGMLHAFIPDGIILKRGANDLANNRIGIQQFCNDLRKAWEELKRSKRHMDYIRGKNVLNVIGKLSGDTQTDISQSI